MKNEWLKMPIHACQRVKTHAIKNAMKTSQTNTIKTPKSVMPPPMKIITAIRFDAKTHSKCNVELTVPVFF